MSIETEIDDRVLYVFPHDGIKLRPAYRRKGESVEELTGQWLSGKDMKILDGPYRNIRDREKMIDQFGKVYLQGSTSGVIWWIEV